MKLLKKVNKTITYKIKMLRAILKRYDLKLVYLKSFVRMKHHWEYLVVIRVSHNSDALFIYLWHGTYQLKIMKY